MPLKNYTAICPGGYVYEQKGKDGAVIKRFWSTSMPFKQFVRPIQQMREANGLDRPNINDVMQDVDEAQCERLNFDPEWCQKKTGGFLSSRSLRSASAGVQAAASRFRQMASFSEGLKNGAATLKDWSDDGFAAVASDEAQNRSDICTGRLSGNPCPFNTNPDIKLPDSLADIIKGQLEKKNGMKLVVEGEQDLNICTVCACFLKLKVWTPMETILGRMTPDTIEKFATQYPPCWMNKPQTPAP